MRVRLKVCCIASVEEAALAVRLGADALGLVSAMPSGPGVIDESLIPRISRTVPPGVATFLLTSRTEGEAIADQAAAAGVGVVQLVDVVEPSAYGVIRRRLPAVRIVQVLHVWEEEAIEEARRCGPEVDALLLDSGRPRPGYGAVKTLGGTGQVHNWDVSARIVAETGKPVFLAGGLNAGNAAEAIVRVRPFGLDVCTGVRTAGRLDEGKLLAMVAAMQK